MKQTLGLAHNNLSRFHPAPEAIWWLKNSRQTVMIESIPPYDDDDDDRQKEEDENLFAVLTGLILSLVIMLSIGSISPRPPVTPMEERTGQLSEMRNAEKEWMDKAHNKYAYPWKTKEYKPDTVSPTYHSHTSH